MPSNEQRDRLGEFLRIRRGALQPEDAGLPKRANRRLTPGLRREEVAELAGISVSWYTRLEQGKDVQMSAKALHGIAAALKLSAAERDYLLDPCLNLVAWNQAANDVFGATAEPFGDFADVPEPERNLLWMIFTEQAQRIFVHWERHARLLLAQFRDASRHFVGDPWIAGLVERLTERSPEFAEWWSHHDVERVQEIEKAIDHPKVGLVALRQTVLQLVDDSPGLFLVLYTPAPDTDTAEKLQKLAIDAAGRDDAPFVPGVRRTTKSGHKQG